MPAMRLSIEGGLLWSRLESLTDNKAGTGARNGRGKKAWINTG